MDRFHPDRWFSPALGSASTIHTRPTIRHWYTALAGASDHIHLETIGTSTEGNPIDALFIADDMSAAAWHRHRMVRLRHKESILSGKWTHEIDDLDQRPVVLVTSGIHATEIGGPQSIPTLVHWLVSSEEPAAQRIREKLITIIVPTLNPDGQDLIDAWHATSKGTPQAGDLPPLLYHRFAGHDNNRDWVFRNLIETSVVMDAIHAAWLPHVTLDQHQMSRFGPRFALPPFCDPWNPWVPAEIIAGSAMLGQAIASDMTSAGFAGIQTSKYFDAWEPSRAIQHFRGGIRILAEAASARLAEPITISEDQLRNPPMALSQRPSLGQPGPWPGGTWRLADIVAYHLAAAKSLLGVVAESPTRYISIQERALSRSGASHVSYRTNPDADVPDAGAQALLGRILNDAGTCIPENPTLVDGANPLSRLADALLRPGEFPSEHGASSYDITSHHLPLMMGALVQVTTGPATASTTHHDRDRNSQGAFLLIDARSHQAPMIIEQALREGRGVWRGTRAQLSGGVLVHPGSWIVEATDDDISRAGAIVSARRIEALPTGALPVQRRDIVLASITDEPSADLGWSRLWLQRQRIPFLETRHLERLDPWPGTRLLLLPDGEHKALPDSTLARLDRWLQEGGNILTFGRTARTVCPAIVEGLSVIDTDSEATLIAPGAIVGIRPHGRHVATMGLDRTIPAVHAHDGAFASETGDRSLPVATFSQPDPVLSGWMGGAGHIAGKAAIVEHHTGSGTLWGFAFRPLFRAQSLATSPLVHNLIYQVSERQDQP